MITALLLAAAIQSTTIEHYVARRTVFAECVQTLARKARQSGITNAQFAVLYDESCAAERDAADKAAVAALLERNGGDVPAAEARVKSGSAVVKRHYLEVYASGVSDLEYPLYSPPSPPKPPQKK